MCLLIVSPAGTNIPESHIETAADFNRDGYGWAMVNRFCEIETFKTMSLSLAMETFYEERAKNPEGDALFHLRISTAGTVDTFNCHPFYVNNDDRTVMAHNGILPIRPALHDPRSDTHILASEWMGQIGIGSLDDEEWFEAFGKWAAGSKLAFLSVDPALKKFLYIVNEHAGDWVDGVWYSNDMWQESYGHWSYSHGSYSSGWGRVVTPKQTPKSRSVDNITVQSFDNLNWPSWSSVPLPMDGFAYTEEELDKVSALGLWVAECEFCSADIAYEHSIPDICWCCHMDPLENPYTRAARDQRKLLSEQGDIVWSPEEQEHSFVPRDFVHPEDERTEAERVIINGKPTDDYLPGSVYYRTDGAFVWDNMHKRWVQYITSDGDFAAWRESFISMLAAANEPTDDVIFGQVATDEAAIRELEANSVDA